MSTDRKFNLFVRLFALRTQKDGSREWRKVTECRIDESFVAVPLVAEAVAKLADQTRVDLSFDPNSTNLSQVIDEVLKAKKRTRSALTETAFDALLHKLNGIRDYARKAGPQNVQVELAAWQRNA
jgi:nicotinamidase-related amidase